MIKSKLNKYRYFDPDPIIREIAYELYSKNKDLPIVCPHGHVDPGLFTEDKPFSNPTELILIPDHYVFRLMYSQGVKLESLGIPTIDGTEIETDPRKIWQIFGDHFYLYAGTPTGQWLNHEFKMVFDIDIELNSDTAMEFYDGLNNKLQQPEYFPMALFHGRSAGSLSWAIRVGKFKLGSLSWAVRVGQFELGSSSWAIRVGKFKLGSSSWAVRVGQFQLGSSRWAVQVGQFELGSSSWAVRVGQFELGSSSWAV